MKVIEHNIDFADVCPNGLPYLKPDTLLFDIETTGFSAKTARLYMIGAAYLEGEELRIKQFLTQSKEDEVFLLITFFNFCKSFSACITYNGSGFDIPFLREKEARYKLTNSFPDMKIIDLYKELKPYKKIFKLVDLKQKTIEQFLGIEREDMYTGGELISHYLRYEKQPSDKEEQLLFLHNYEDILGMAKLLAIQAYLDVFQGQFHFVSATRNQSINYYGAMEERLVLAAKTNTTIPVPISYSYDGYYITLHDDSLMLSTPISNDTIRVPYLDYKNYYYLVKEDIAILKSMATYIDKTDRVNATPKTAYGKYTLTRECLTSATLFEPYIQSVLTLLLTT
ncbi:hypothetical protein SAMN02910358_00120 [Lachnospiraceae bacterium XBB1006]|nr:hypothetical protein SAMN02910358_00120 [Lachnospiraceae bacterium XBB1006]